MITLTILIPVRNEELNVSIMVRILSSVLEIPHEIIIIYDSPKDTTIPIAKKLQTKYRKVRLIRNTLGKGITNALKVGVQAAKGTYILIFAADEIGPVVAIEDMLMLMEQGCDFVSCTRYAYGGRRLGGSLIGGLLSKLANFIMHNFANMALTDATTGIKMFKRKDFLRFELTAKTGWAVAFELSMKAQLEGLKFGEVPIISVDRLFGGTSTFRLGPWINEYTKWLVWGFVNLRKSPSQNQSVLTVDKIAGKGKRR